MGLADRISRRRFVMVGLGIFATGCANSTHRLTDRPRPVWPTNAPPTPTPAHAPITSTPILASAPIPVRATPLPTIDPTIRASRNLPFHVVPRTLWTRRPPVTNRLTPMAGINRVTLHHEGWRPVWFADTGATVERLQFIQQFHVDQRNWADIGYHFIIDRAGRVWEGRPLIYQGAHVKENNEHNIGVMVLGNFDEQSASQEQMTSLESTLVHLMRTYRIPVSRIQTHQEINPTACPGRSLQPQTVSLRRTIA